MWVLWPSAGSRGQLTTALPGWVFTIPQIIEAVLKQRGRKLGLALVWELAVTWRHLSQPLYFIYMEGGKHHAEASWKQRLTRIPRPDSGRAGTGIYMSWSNDAFSAKRGESTFYIPPTKHCVFGPVTTSVAALLTSSCRCGGWCPIFPDFRLPLVEIAAGSRAQQLRQIRFWRRWRK